MSEQSNLFDTAPYVKGSETSKAAAKRIEPVMGTLRAIILACLRENGPMTDEEMQDRLGLSAHTQCPRRLELVRQGFVVDSGMRRKTRSGRDAIVWMAVSKAGGDDDDA